jgi:Tol biopolymer transport system component
VSTSLAFISHEGDLVVAAWSAEPAAPSQRVVLSRAHPLLRAEDGAAPLALAAPTWSADGGRLAVSARYAVSPQHSSSALAVVDCDGREPPLVVWRSPLAAEANIAPGLPHYVNWSPDGTYLALLAVTPSGMALLVLDPRAERAAVPVLSGAPIFFAWSARSDMLLVHHGPQLTLLRTDDLASPRTLLHGGLGCQLPVWSPSGERFAFSRLHQGSQSLALMAADGSERSVAALPRGYCALAWRPSHDDVAFSIRGAEDGRRSDGLWLLRAAGGEPARLLAGDIGPFFWSPDGSSLAFLAPSPIPGQSCWRVLELRTGSIQCFAPFYEAPELTLQLGFFEQYSVSHRVWSAGGEALSVNGRIPANGTPPDIAGQSVYVQPVQQDVHPIFVAPGTFASWRPR